jgi:hypothetical protein
MERNELMANLKLSWSEYNSGGNCMIWQNEFALGGSVHLTEDVLVLSKLSIEAHLDAMSEHGDSEETAPFVDLVYFFPAHTGGTTSEPDFSELAFKLTPFIGQEHADAVTHDVRLILTFLSSEEDTEDTEDTADNRADIWGRHERNALGRLVTHAERFKGLPVTSEDMVEAMFPGSVERQSAYLRTRLEQLGGAQYTLAWFGFDEGPIWPGMHCGSTWNGWAMPNFTKEVADLIVAHWNSEAAPDAPQSRYIEAEDAYVIGWDIEACPEDFASKPEDYYYRRDPATGLFPLGSGALVWDIYTDKDTIVERAAVDMATVEAMNDMRLHLATANHNLNAALEAAVKLNNDAYASAIQSAIDEIAHIVHAK